jgi:hypothetical protein
MSPEYDLIGVDLAAVGEDQVALAGVTATPIRSFNMAKLRQVSSNLIVRYMTEYLWRNAPELIFDLEVEESEDCCVDWVKEGF